MSKLAFLSGCSFIRTFGCQVLANIIISLNTDIRKDCSEAAVWLLFFQHRLWSFIHDGFVNLFLMKLINTKIISVISRVTGNLNSSLVSFFSVWSKCISRILEIYHIKHHQVDSCIETFAVKTLNGYLDEGILNPLWWVWIISYA